MSVERSEPEGLSLSNGLSVERSAPKGAVFLSYASPAVAQPLWRGKQDARRRQGYGGQAPAAENLLR